MQFADLVLSWLFDACFPLWASAGPDPRGGFRERLTLEGAPIDDAQTRVRVQARQTFVFAQAALMGWRRDTALDLVRRGAGIMLEGCRRPDFLFGKMMRAGGGLADPQPDLYDNAFCLMALAWAARALGEGRLLDEADRTLAALDAQMAHPFGGYLETLPKTLPRRQNPHMHLFEAALALHAADPSRGYLARADAIAALLQEKFLDAATGALREFFDDEWTPAAGPEGAIVEPGHMFEWSWLLGGYAKAKGVAPLAAQRTLYAAALPFADARGLAPQTADRHGRIRDGSRRTWPQTEALKAHLATLEAGDAAAAARADLVLSSLFTDYLDGVPKGLWRDHFDGDGRMLAQDAPASTGYHIVLALTEYVRVAGGGRAATADPRL